MEVILSPSISRYDARHFVISYIIKHLDHSSVYELMVQAKNKIGWNEVSLCVQKGYVCTYKSDDDE